MFIKILGTRGEEYFAAPKLHEKFSSILITSQGKKLQADAGNAIREKLDILLITHTHPIHVNGILNPDKYTTKRKFLIAVPKPLIKTLKRTKQTIIPLETLKRNRIKNFTVIPFSVPHDPNIKCYGYFIKSEGFRIGYLPNYKRVPVALINKAQDLLFLGAYRYKKDSREKQQSVIKALKDIAKFKRKPKRIILLHLGPKMTPIGKKVKELAKIVPLSRVEAGYDGQIISFSDIVKSS